MHKTLAIVCALAGCTFSGDGLAGKSAERSAAVSVPVRSIVIPGTNYHVTLGKPPSASGGELPARPLLNAIATWLTANFKLPPSAPLPHVRLVSSAKITTLRHTGILSDRHQDVAAVPPGQREVVAVYDPDSGTIYLPREWTGNTPAELSMLVHEMVHHLQHAGQMRYECPEASEALAYAAQDRWLRLFGRDLATDFDLDPFTLLAASRCIY